MREVLILAMGIMRFVSLLLLCTLGLSSAYGVLSLNIEVFDDTTFLGQISGTIDPDANIGTEFSNVLYLWSPQGTDWVIAGVPDNPLPVNDSGVTNQATTVSSSRNPDNSEYISFFTEYTIAAGQVFSFSFEVLGGGAVFNPENVDASSFILSAGYNSGDPFPDPNTQVGGVVPEPATYAVLIGVGAFAVAGWRRLRS